MTEPSDDKPTTDYTELNASQRDVLQAVGAALEGPQPPTTTDVISIAQNASERVSEQRARQLMSELTEMGLLTRGDGPSTSARGRNPDVVGLTLDGEQLLADMAERSTDVADPEVTP